MDKKGKSSCVLNICSIFLPYLDDVIGKGTDLEKFYHFEVMNDNVPVSTKHYFLMRLSKKSRIGGANED